MPSSNQRKPEEEVWFVHAPLKKEKRDIVLTNPPSNIPYLNGVLDQKSSESKAPPTIWFKSTDSDFIRLSKMGGRPDLLIHKPPQRQNDPVDYPRAAWWTDMLTEVEKSDKGVKK